MAATVVLLAVTACSSASRSQPSSTVGVVQPSTASTASTTSTTQPSAAVQGWAQDMRALGDGVRRIHPNPFWRQSEDEFDAALAAAPEQLAMMSVTDATAFVMRLMAGFDGHTGVYLSEAGFHLYALHLYGFGDDIAVVGAPDPALFGATVVSIDGTPIADAVAAVRPWSPYDNAATIDLVVPLLLMTPEVLHAAGVVDDVAVPHFVVRLANGTEHTLEPAQLTWDEFVDQIDPTPVGMGQIESIPSMARISEPFWTEVVGSAIVLHDNAIVRSSGTTNISTVADEIDGALSSGAANRLVVDLRFNPGGDTDEYAPLLRVLTTNPALQRPGSLVVLIGKQTFSAAVLLATELGQQTGAVFIGEPTGGSPNLYANPRPLKLPNSGIVVEVSSHYFELGGPDDRRDAVAPDVPVALTLDDLLAGRDPVLDAALSLA